MQVLNGPVTAFSMPEDGAEAEQSFLEILNNEHETYLEMYGDTLKELYDAIKVADAQGVVLHGLVDHTQECGPTEKAMMQDLVNTLVHSDTTVTTAGPDAEKSSEIAHRKRMMDVSGNVFFGSVNASHDGFFSQTNDAVTFNDPTYVAEAIKRFEIRKAWALEHLPHAQIVKQEKTNETPV